MLDPAAFIAITLYRYVLPFVNPVCVYPVWETLTRSEKKGDKEPSIKYLISYWVAPVTLVHCKTDDLFAPVPLSTASEVGGVGGKQLHNATQIGVFK